MNPEKTVHLRDEDILASEQKKRTELLLPNGGGRIVSYHPFNSMQLIFFDVHSSEIPDMWRLGFRKGDDGRYLRTLVCRQGGCEYTINGENGALPAGQVLMDFGAKDNKSFNFTCGEFVGIEITMQVDTLVKESSMLRMLKQFIKAMRLPEGEIFDSDGYLFPYSKSTEQTLDKLVNSGLDGADGIVLIALTIEIGHSLGTDLKELSAGKRTDVSKKQLMIAEDIYNCLTDDFGTKYTAAYFAEKYGVSDTTVKKYFKNVYGYGFKEYQTKVRMEWAVDKLTTTDMKVGEISDSSGYSKHTEFSKAFKKHYGVTPLVYRRAYKMKMNDRK